ncbi:hypothetical protein ACIBF1_15420 [Spirillospora sp. NPDC050679]
MPDDDRFPKERAKGWDRAMNVGLAHPPDAGTTDGAVPAEVRQAVTRALISSIDLLPEGGLNLTGTAEEVLRLARLMAKAGPDAVDLCQAFHPSGTGHPAGSIESGRLLGQVARMLLATMGGDLADMVVSEVAPLLAREFLRALARRSGLERGLPFRPVPAQRSLAVMERMLAEPVLTELVPLFLERAGANVPAEDGGTGAA